MSALDNVIERMSDATSGFLQPSYLKEGFAAVPDDVLVDLFRERHMHIDGWETFGVAHVTTPQSDPVSRPIKGGVEWPDAECHGGIFCIVVQAHGDDPAGAFVKVVGPDRAAVEACFTRTVTAVRSLLGEVWP